MEEQNKCEKEKADILKRLNRIEGQIKGIQRMVSEEQGCTEVLTQVAAVRSAVNRVGSIILERYSHSSISDNLGEEDKEKKIKDLVDTIQKFLNFVD